MTHAAQHRAGARRSDLFGRLALLTLVGVTPLAVTSLAADSTPDESQALFLRWGAAMAAVAFAAAALPRRLATPSAGPLLVIAFGLWCLASAAWAAAPWASLHDVSSLAAGLAIYLLVVSVRLPTPRLLAPLLWMVVAVALLNAALACLQFVASQGPLASTPLSALLSRSLGYGRTVLEGKANIRALFGHPNFLAGYLVPALALAGVLMATPRARRPLALVLAVVTVPAALVVWRAGEDSAWLAPAVVGAVGALATLAWMVAQWPWIRHIVAGVALLGIVGAVVICRSRSGWLALVVVAVMAAAAAWSHRRLRSWQAIALALALIAAGVGLIALRQHRRETRSWEEVATLSTVTSRVYTFMIAAEMVRQHPVLGWGFGAFKTGYYQAVADFQRTSPDAELYQAHLIEAQGRPPYHVHNDFFEVAVETGLIGLGLLCALLAWTAAGLVRRTLASPATDQTWVTLGVGLALLAILVDATMSFPLSLPLTSSLFWLLMGAAHRLIR